jgi:peptidoglycan/xylan/chitin deacetylase (PgdA/CDA1 family)
VGVQKILSGFLTRLFSVSTVQIFLLKFLLKFRKVGVILVGHGFAPRVTDPVIESQHKLLAQLDHAIHDCSKLGFRFLSMEELLRLKQAGFRASFSWVHLTFDDGYQNNYTRLVPFLKERQLPFTLFVTTGAVAKEEWQFVDRVYCAFLRTSKKVWQDEADRPIPIPEDRSSRIQLADAVFAVLRESGKPEAESLMARVDDLLPPQEWKICRERYKENQLMTPAQLAQLAADPLVCIGSHGHHHFSFNASLREEDVRDEMNASRVWLNDITGTETMAFAFPYGQAVDITPLAKTICQQVGYTIGFTTLDGAVIPGADPLFLPRLAVPSDTRDFYRRLLKYLLPKVLVKWILWLKRPVLK